MCNPGWGFFPLRTQRLETWHDTSTQCNTHVATLGGGPRDLALAWPCDGEPCAAGSELGGGTQSERGRGNSVSERPDIRRQERHPFKPEQRPGSWEQD